MESKIKSFNGNGDAKVFVEKVQLHSALKGYTGENAAQNLASRLEGRAFDVYLRLSNEDKKSFDRIKQELLKKFEQGHMNREEAISKLASRSQNEDESPQTFAYHIQELVKLAYPSFDEDVLKTIAKDYYIKGMHPRMQVALKSLSKFNSLDIKALANETTRLTTAGIESFMSTKGGQCRAIAEPNYDNLVDTVADKVMEKLKDLTLCHSAEPESPSNVNYITNRVGRNTRKSNNNHYLDQRRNYRGKSQQQSRTGGNSSLRCRCCQSTDHLVRNCPLRFCQACGNKGHDAWDQSCPKYQ